MVEEPLAQEDSQVHEEVFRDGLDAGNQSLATVLDDEVTILPEL